MRAPEFLEQPLAVERFHLRAVQLEGVDREPPGARLGERALQHLLAGGAPGSTLTPYFFSNACEIGTESLVLSEV